jgi:hypothetical protein
MHRCNDGLGSQEVVLFEGLKLKREEEEEEAEEVSGAYRSGFCLRLRQCLGH